MKCVVPRASGHGFLGRAAQLLVISAAFAVAGCGDNHDATSTTDAPDEPPDTSPIEPPGTAPIALAAGHNHTCFVDANQALWCWGENIYGQLGDGTHSSSSTPRRIGETSTWQSVTAAWDHTCGVRTDGTLWCWGVNWSGQLGDGTEIERDVPTQVGAATNWRTVSAHSGHACAIRADQTLWCWGYNGYGELGIGTTDNSHVPVQVGTAHWRSVALGNEVSCGIQMDNTLWCWGQNLSDDLNEFRLLVPTREPTNSTWKAVVMGDENMCGLHTDSSLYCWGGLGVHNFGSEIPGRVEADNDWVQLSSGDGDVAGVNLGSNHTCGIRSDRSLWCFASMPTTTDVVTKRFDTRNDWQAIAAGGNHLCGARSDGTLWCWGSNSRGQLGQGNLLGGPVQVGGPSDWLSAGANDNGTCGVHADGTLWCWGYVNSAQKSSQVPVQVGSTTTWQSLDGQVGTQQDGSVWNVVGDGVGDAPVKLGSIADWKSFSRADSHSCAVRNDGTLWCKGGNDQGQLGDGTVVAHTDFAQVGTANDWASVSAAGVNGSDIAGNDANWGHTCGVRGEGDLWCWGGNINGEIGDGSKTDRHEPVRIDPAGVWQSVSTDAWYTCALRRDGSLWCWGRNEFGQLGNGAEGPLGTDGPVGPLWTSVPMQEHTASTWRSISAGNMTMCAIKSDGSLSCWGSIASDLASAANPNVPTPIGTATDWQTISTASGHACGMRSGGSLWCLGAGGGGVLGDNNAWRTEAVPVSIPH